MRPTIGLILGSLRENSSSSLLARAVKVSLGEELTFLDIPIGDLPLYNQDLETNNLPAAWMKFRTAVAAADGIVFITPEYNRGIPGALKNALDVGSRPYGRGVWKGKPTAIISQSTGILGATAANQQLRLILSVMESPVLPGNEMYIPKVTSLFDSTGQLTAPDTANLLKTFLVAFDAWIKRLR